MEITDDFLTPEEYQIAEHAVFTTKWNRYAPSQIKRQEIDLPFLKKLCKPSEDYFSYVYLMDENKNPSMEWHKDIADKNRGIKLKPGQKWIGEATQWILYMGGDFQGGLLHTRDQTVEPVPNRLVLLNPFEEEHKVDPVIGRRYSLGGFIYAYEKI